MTDRPRIDHEPAHWHYSALASRLILSAMTLNEDAHAQITDEIGRCVHCWQAVADDLAATLAEHLTVGDVENRIAYALDRLAEQ